MFYFSTLDDICHLEECYEDYMQACDKQNIKCLSFEEWKTQIYDNEE